MTAAPSLLGRLKDAIRRALDFEARRGERERAVLLRMCFGDHDAVDRLIAGERARRPGLSEAEACRRAVRRIRRDNR